LNHKAPTQRISSGNTRLDTMLGGKGFYRGSSILVSGTAGTGKSTIAAHFVDAACRRGERALFFAFEESQDQIIRNMRSVGIELEPYVKRDLLRFKTARPSNFGLEVHLALMHKSIAEYEPAVVVVDPITNFLVVGDTPETKSMLTRLIDYLKMRQVTAMFTSLTGSTTEIEDSEVGVSSLIDTWLLVKNVEANGERNRGLYVLKARGIGHSNQVREFLLTDHGMELLDTYVGSDGVLMGSARAAQAARETAALVQREATQQRKQRELQRKQEIYEAQLVTLRSQYESERDALLKEIEEDEKRESMIASQRVEMARLRHADIALDVEENGAPKVRKGTAR
jgi:circadian clock protein KaiC